MISLSCRAKRFDDEVETVVAEKHLIADEYRWGAEDPALGGGPCFRAQFGDHGLGAGTFEEPFATKARPAQDVEQCGTL